MAELPKLTVSGLSGASAEEAAATSSPARGKEMRANLLNKLRAPPLVHAWDFWHDRQDRTNSSSSSSAPPPTAGKPNYEDRLKHLASITDVKTFWSVFNNFDVVSLPLRDSVHLFHRGVKPLWEDPRNERGGCWTFRVPKEKASAFWEHVCLLAIGEKLQAAVESDRVMFRDDICGVSLSVRFTSILISIWNRDAGHDEGVKKILETVLGSLKPELVPRENSYYYKPHNEHAAFGGGGEAAKQGSSADKIT